MDQKFASEVEFRDFIDGRLNTVEALAGILGALASQWEMNSDYDPEPFRFHGAKYLDAVESAAREAKEAFDQFYKGLPGSKGTSAFSVKALETRLSFLRNSTRREDLLHVEDSLKEIDEIMARVFIPMGRMKNELEKIRSRILEAGKPEEKER